VRALATHPRADRSARGARDVLDAVAEFGATRAPPGDEITPIRAGPT
jgi:hypothetical protein